MSTWRLDALAFDIWYLAFGFWHLALGIWHLAFGIRIRIRIRIRIDFWQLQNAELSKLYALVGLGSVAFEVLDELVFGDAVVRLDQAIDLVKQSLDSRPEIWADDRKMFNCGQLAQHSEWQRRQQYAQQRAHNAPELVGGNKRFLVGVVLLSVHQLGSFEGRQNFTGCRTCLCNASVFFGAEPEVLSPSYSTQTTNDWPNVCATLRFQYCLLCCFVLSWTTVTAIASKKYGMEMPLQSFSAFGVLCNSSATRQQSAGFNAIHLAVVMLNRT